MSEREKWYEEFMGPAIDTLGEACKEKKVHFVALTQYEDGNYRQAYVSDGTCCPTLKIASLIAGYGGNMDKTLIHLCAKHPEIVESSEILKVLHKSLMSGALGSEAGKPEDD